MISDLKELNSFLKICRKLGVTDISYQGVTVKFGEMPSDKTSSDEKADEIPTDELTPEQLAFYAVSGGQG